MSIFELKLINNNYIAVTIIRIYILKLLTMKSLIKKAKPSVFILCTLFVLTFSSITGQQISTVAEVYNYDAGDIFHVREFGASGGGGFVENYSFEIISKNYSTNNDTLIYTRHVKTAYSSSEHPDWIYNDYYDTITYFDFDSLINDGDIDTVYSDSNLYNGRLINLKDLSSEYIQEYYQYIEGCGGYYRHFFDIENNFSYYYELKYFKKGNEEWGEQLMVSTGPDLIKNNKLYAFPNPIHNTLKLDLTDQISTDTEGFIYSISGNKIHSFHLKANQLNVIELPELKEGIYMLQVKDYPQYNQLIIKM